MDERKLDAEVVGLLSGTLTAMSGIMRERLSPAIRAALKPYVTELYLDEATSEVLAAVLPPVDFDASELFRD